MPRYTYHDAKTGEFVTAGHAHDNPDSTVRIEQHPNLGMATTKELVDELAARAHVAATIGESWPNYTTVGSE